MTATAPPILTNNDDGLSRSTSGSPLDPIESVPLSRSQLFDSSMAFLDYNDKSVAVTSITSTITSNRYILENSIVNSIQVTGPVQHPSEITRIPDVVAITVSGGFFGSNSRSGTLATGSGFPDFTTNGSWIFSKSGWTIAPTTVPGTSNTIKLFPTALASLHPNDQTAPSGKMPPSSGTGGAILSLSGTPFTGVANKLYGHTTIHILVLLNIMLGFSIYIINDCFGGEFQD